MRCILCGRGTRSGSWERLGFKRQWVCYDCQKSGKYQPEYEGRLCWRHGLPMRPAGGCVQCEKEGY